MRLDFIEKRQIVRGARLYRPINDLLILFSAISHAASLMVGGTTHRAEKPLARLNPIQFDHAIAVPLRGPLEHAISGTQPGLIEIGLVTKAGGFGPDNSFQTGGLEGAFLGVASMIYLSFFERQIPWLLEHVNSDRNQWGQLFGFGRLLRNAAAHGGFASIDNPNAPVVTWRGLSYSHAQNGKRVIGDDLVSADLVMFMLELDAELDALGAPHL